MCLAFAAACCLLPALAHHRQSEEGTQRPWVRGPGHGEHVSSHQPVTSTLCDPRVTLEVTQAACAGVRACPLQTRGPWSAQSMAHLLSGQGPCERS